ncbi:unnamed protein product [Moneuplotes crassus]|uniref:Uncharacterized protein n=1 Tax=Euplotes crassus TaxID=5936 RepID=A0AAD1U4C0_EUPCR|nr:unnamed protein product [Moneuplotes crassus]
MESSVSDHHERKSKVIEQETSILMKSKEDDYKRCKDIFYKFEEDELNIKLLRSYSPEGSEKSEISERSEGSEESEESEFNFWLEDTENFDYIKELCPLKFFDIDKISLYSIKLKDKQIRNFIKYSFPDKINAVWASFRPTEMINNSKYFKYIISLSSKDLKEVRLSNFYFNSSQFKKLITSFRHVKMLDANLCRLSIPTPPDFSNSLKNSKIENFEFSGSTDKYNIDCKKSLNDYKNLIEGLGTSLDFRKSLKEIFIGSWGADYEEAYEFFQQSKLSKARLKICI